MPKVVETVFIQNDQNVVRLEDMLAVEDHKKCEDLDVFSVRKLLSRVLQNEPKVNQKTFDLHLSKMTQKEIAKIVGLSQCHVSRIVKRIQKKLKKQAIQEELLEEVVRFPAAKKSKKMKKEDLATVDVGKLKYIRTHYDYLTSKDIAVILGVRPLVVAHLIHHPNLAYRQTEEDRSIEKTVQEYVQEHYPERVPSKLVVYYQTTNREEDEIMSSKPTLTKEELVRLKNEGVSDVKIMEDYGLNNVSYYTLKRQFGLVTNGKPTNENVKSDVKVEAEETKTDRNLEKELAKLKRSNELLADELKHQKTLVNRLSVDSTTFKEVIEVLSKENHDLKEQLEELRTQKQQTNDATLVISHAKLEEENIALRNCLKFYL